MPVGPSHGASGHDATAVIVFSSITWIVLVPSLLTKIFPLPSLAAPSGPLSSSWTVPTMAPLFGSMATTVPIGRLWLVRMMRSEKSSYMMPSRPPVGTGIRLMTARVAMSNISTVESPALVMNPWPDLGASAMPYFATLNDCAELTPGHVRAAPTSSARVWIDGSYIRVLGDGREDAP